MILFRFTWFLISKPTITYWTHVRRLTGVQRKRKTSETREGNKKLVSLDLATWKLRLFYQCLFHLTSKEKKLQKFTQNRQVIWKKVCWRFTVHELEHELGLCLELGWTSRVLLHHFYLDLVSPGPIIADRKHSKHGRKDSKVQVGLNLINMANLCGREDILKNIWHFKKLFFRLKEVVWPLHTNHPPVLE